MAEGLDFQYKGLVLNKAALDQMLNSPTGEVGKHMASRGRLIVIAAKRQVGVDTGALRTSIHMIHRRVGLGQELWIGSDNEIAYLHHQGSRPHRMTARSHNAMRFSAGGRMVYTHNVMHPGTRPNRYLSDNLGLVRV